MDLRTFLHSSSARFPNLLKDVDLDYSVDHEIETLITGFQQAKPAFWPDQYQTEELLPDVGQLLDRLLSLRREIMSIEGERVRTALSYAALLEQADWEYELKCAESTSAAIEAAAAGRRRSLQNHVEILEARHADPRGPLNFLDRSARLRAEMRSVVRSAHYRSRALYAGAMKYSAATLNLTLPRPGKIQYADFDQAAYLDDWCAWHRAFSRELESVAERFVSHEYVLSLGKPWLNRWISTVAAPGGGNALHEFSQRHEALQKDLLKTLREGTITINLAPAPGNLAMQETIDPLFFVHETWLRAFGISITLAAGQENLWKFGAAVSLSEVPSRITLANIGHNSVAWNDDRSIRNRSPNAVWKIRFLPNPFHGGGTTDEARLNPANWPILDVHLHLRTVGFR